MSTVLTRNINETVDWMFHPHPQTFECSRSSEEGSTDFESEEQTKDNELRLMLMSSQGLDTNTDAVVPSKTADKEAEKRERNRLAQQRYRRNQRNELNLMRHKAVKSFERERELRYQLARVSQEKASALLQVETQKRLIEVMEGKFKNCMEEYADLKTKFDALINEHCELLKRTNAMVRYGTEQATRQFACSKH